VIDVSDVRKRARGIREFAQRSPEITFVIAHTKELALPSWFLLSISEDDLVRFIGILDLAAKNLRLRRAVLDLYGGPGGLPSAWGPDEDDY